MAQGLHNLPSARLQKRLWWSSWSNVSRRRKPFGLIFRILVIEKNDFDEVA
jgi:hypothetical protein